MLTEYSVKSKNDGYVWQFKYDLNGDLKTFNILSGVISQRQQHWLFQKGNFPVFEANMKEWIDKLKQNFEITKGEIDLSFESFWKVYNNKVGKRVQTKNYWERLSKAEKIKVMLNISKYDNYLKYYPKQQKLYPSTYLNQESYLNDWKV